MSTWVWWGLVCLGRGGGWSWFRVCGLYSAPVALSLCMAYSLCVWLCSLFDMVCVVVGFSRALPDTRKGEPNGSPLESPPYLLSSMGDSRLARAR